MGYKIGDVLVANKHIGIAKYVGRLHAKDYKQLPSESQNFIKSTDIWVGLQLAEEPNMDSLCIMKQQNTASPKAIPYHCLNTISFCDYFSAHYGILIPLKYIHKKINPHQILIKLTQLFHCLKKTKKINQCLTESINKLKSEMNTTKKVQSTETSQKSLEEKIIYEPNGNVEHHQKITTQTTHTTHTTHSYKSSLNEDDIIVDKEDVDMHIPNDNDNDNESDKAVEGVTDNHSDRNLSEHGNELLLDISFNPEEDIINEEDEQDFTERNESSSHSNSNHSSSHVRRYSAPWDNKKLTNNEFGSEYERIYGSSYWKNSGSRIIKQENEKNERKKKTKNKNVRRNNDKQSMELLNVLPMIKEDPETNRIYRLSKVQQNQQNMRERHKRSMSMSVVKLGFVCIVTCI